MWVGYAVASCISFITDVVVALVQDASTSTSKMVMATERLDLIGIVIISSDFGT